MKYIITESKIENMIKEYILKNFDVMEVDFDSKSVYLGSGPNEKGQTSVEQRVIVVYINNIKNKKRTSDLRNIKSGIYNVIKNLFGIDVALYGSEWSLVIYQVRREEI